MSSNRVAQKPKPPKWYLSDTFLTLSVVLVAAILILASGASDKWLSAVYATAPFIAIITLDRTNWKLTRFWVVVTTAFAIHLVLIWAIFEILLKDRRDVSLV